MMIDDIGSSKVTVRKAELLKAIKANREKHEAEYKETEAAFRGKAIEMLKMYAQRAELGGEVQTSLDIERPQSHVNDYDVVIEMLEISTADEILISQLQFRQYVRDEWSWKHDFIANSAFYKGGPVA